MRALAGCWLVACLLSIALAQQRECLLERPPSKAPLEESHPRLARVAGAGPHTPEQVKISSVLIVGDLPQARRELEVAPPGPILCLLQVHLAFAGPASYAVTWVTHPLEDVNLVEALVEAEEEQQQQQVPASRRLAAAGSGAAAAAAQQPHLGAAAEADAAQAAAGAQLGADSLERRKRKHRRRRKRTCKHVVRAAGRSVVQYGVKPGEYEHTGRCVWIRDGG